MNMGPILNGYRDMVKRRASTNSNYVVNNITTNITCMQVLTIVLLIICNGQNPGSSTSGTSHNKFQRCICERVAGYCVLHAVAHDGGPLYGHRHC